MKVGLGTGSTAAFAVERLGALLKSGEVTDIIAVPTSVRTKEQAEELGIPLTTLDEFSRLDVAIDGADEVDPVAHEGNAPPPHWRTRTPPTVRAFRLELRRERL